MNIFNTIKRYLWELRHPLFKSQHLNEYEEIASHFQIPAKRVYRIAHGSRPKYYIEQLVLQELISRGIVNRV